jgi:hypothetical protein
MNQALLEIAMLTGNKVFRQNHFAVSESLLQPAAHKNMLHAWRKAAARTGPVQMLTPEHSSFGKVRRSHDGPPQGYLVCGLAFGAHYLFNPEHLLGHADTVHHGPQFRRVCGKLMIAECGQVLIQREVLFHHPRTAGHRKNRCLYAKGMV